MSVCHESPDKLSQNQLFDASGCLRVGKKANKIVIKAVLLPLTGSNSHKVRLNMSDIRGPFCFAFVTDKGRLLTTSITVCALCWGSVLNVAAKTLHPYAPLGFIRSRRIAVVADVAAGPTLAECIEARKSSAIGVAHPLWDEASLPPRSWYLLHDAEPGAFNEVLNILML